MTVRDGWPPFTTWQRETLPPSFGRSLRNMTGDLTYTLRPAMAALAEVFTKAAEAFGDFAAAFEAAGLLELDEVTP